MAPCSDVLSRFKLGSGQVASAVVLQQVSLATLLPLVSCVLYSVIRCLSHPLSGVSSADSLCPLHSLVVGMLNDE